VGALENVRARTRGKQSWLQTNAHAGSRTRVTSMEGLYDTATLRAPCLGSGPRQHAHATQKNPNAHTRTHTHTPTLTATVHRRHTRQRTDAATTRTRNARPSRNTRPKQETCRRTRHQNNAPSLFQPKTATLKDIAIAPMTITRYGRLADTLR
jgi:hypothetical protein